MTSPTEGGSGGASPPAFTRTTITSKSPSEAVFIWAFRSAGGRLLDLPERGEKGGRKEKKEEKGEGKKGRKGRPLIFSSLN